jgi:hypothetical protein
MGDFVLLASVRLVGEREGETMGEPVGLAVSRFVGEAVLRFIQKPNTWYSTVHPMRFKIQTDGEGDTRILKLGYSYVMKDTRIVLVHIILL